MIDWAKTKEKYGYGALKELTGIKRPMVICSCVTCHKEKEIKLRLKQEHIYKCPACVSLERSKEISEQVTNNWKELEYRENQIKRKSETDYKHIQSELSKQRWIDESYSSRLRTGISKEILSKSQFNIIESSDWRTKMKVQCKQCYCTFYITPQRHFESAYCPSCHVSKEQKEISEYLNSINIKHIVNDRTTLSGKELDIYIESHKIAIEYHGLFWHSSNTQESKTQRERHQHKALLCRNLGIRLFQIFEHEWEHKKDLVLSMLKNSFGLSTRINARNTQFQQISNQEAKNFLDENHLQGHRNAKYSFGLTKEKELLSVISFNAYLDGYEIIRLASKQNCLISGGASKLLKNSRKHLKYPKIYTFADLRHSHGTVYNTLNFRETGITPPGYFYYHPNGSIIISRQKCQKHKLEKLLPNFNNDLSESVNMFNNGFRRVWTAGNIKFELID